MTLCEIFRSDTRLGDRSARTGFCMQHRKMIRHYLGNRCNLLRRARKNCGRVIINRQNNRVVTIEMKFQWKNANSLRNNYGKAGLNADSRDKEN